MTLTTEEIGIVILSLVSFVTFLIVISTAINEFIELFPEIDSLGDDEPINRKI